MSSSSCKAVQPPAPPLGPRADRAALTAAEVSRTETFPHPADLTAFNTLLSRIPQVLHFLHCQRLRKVREKKKKRKVRGSMCSVHFIVPDKVVLKRIKQKTLSTTYYLFISQFHPPKARNTV